MTNPFQMQAGCPEAMRVVRAGEGITAAPEGVSSGAFLVQMLLSSRREGEMTAMRAFVPPGIATHWHSHPRGQLLYVLDGVGRVQREGGDPVECARGMPSGLPPTSAIGTAPCRTPRSAISAFNP